MLVRPEAVNVSGEPKQVLGALEVRELIVGQVPQLPGPDSDICSVAEQVFELDTVTK